MQFKSTKAVVYDVKNANKAPVRYFAVSAHHDDIEIMAADGIGRGYRTDGGSFYAAVCTDGAGSARSGKYADYTDEQMKAVRVTEQESAAEIGHYHGLTLLNYTSSQAKAETPELVEDIATLIRTVKPQIMYTHNLCDKHPTHVGVVKKVIAAIRSLPVDERPEKLYGCEVWRDLDWLSDDEKVVFDLSKDVELTDSLLSVFDSQIAGGKRYDLATAGRRRANATYGQSHSVDSMLAAGYAMDLTPLIKDDALSLKAFVEPKLRDFMQSVLQNL